MRQQNIRQHKDKSVSACISSCPHISSGFSGEKLNIIADMQAPFEFYYKDEPIRRLERALQCRVLNYQRKMARGDDEIYEHNHLRRYC